MLVYPEVDIEASVFDAVIRHLVYSKIEFHSCEVVLDNGRKLGLTTKIHSLPRVRERKISQPVAYKEWETSGPANVVAYGKNLEWTNSIGYQVCVIAFHPYNELLADLAIK